MKKSIALILGLLLTLLCSVSQADVPGFMKERMGTLKGVVQVKGKPLAQAVVSFFDKSVGPPPVVGSVRRVPDVVDRTDDKGAFSVKLLPGTYYMGTLIREPSKGAGPPRQGEEYFFIHDDKGQLREFTIETKKVHDSGRVEGLPPGAFQEFKTFMTIKGKVTGEDGKPLAGAQVTLKQSMESHRPQYVSEGTAADGTFTMKVPPGRYFVVGRESIEGGKPGIGSYIGSYGKTNPTTGEAAPPPNVGSQAGASPAAMGLQSTGGGQAIAIEGKNGEVVDNINIQMFKIPNPGETRARFEAEASKGGGEQFQFDMPTPKTEAPAPAQQK